VNDDNGSIATSAIIAPDALIHSSATIGEDAVIESGVVVGPRCVIGAKSRLRARCIIVQDTTLGEANEVHPYAVLGGDPQDRAYNPETPGKLIIGSRNLIREGVTISRGTMPGPDTVIGDENMLMAQCHIGHNCRVGSNNTFGNGASLAGHVHLGDRNTLSGFALVHQFVNVGDLCMFQGGAGVGMHVPPFVIVTSAVRNTVAGLNIIGLRRTPGFTDEDRREVKDLYRLLFRDRGGKRMEPLLQDAKASASTAAGKRLVEFCLNAMNPENPRRARGLCTARTGGRFDGD